MNLLLLLLVIATWLIYLTDCRRPPFEHGNLPLDYFESLQDYLSSSSSSWAAHQIVSAERIPGSPVTMVAIRDEQTKKEEFDEESDVDEVVSTIRLCHLVSILPLTEEIDGRSSGIRRRRRPLDLSVRSLQVAVFLAVRDFNARSSPLVPSLALSNHTSNECNVYFTLEQRDSQLSPISAVRQLQDAIHLRAKKLPNTNQMNSDNNHRIPSENSTTNITLSPNFPPQQPVAIVGSYLSSVTRLLAELSGVVMTTFDIDDIERIPSGAVGIPIISPTATSTSLENKNKYPTFSRMIPTVRGFAEALCGYWSQGPFKVQNFAILYLEDEYGSSLAQYLQDVAKEKYQIQVTAVPYSWNEISHEEGGNNNEAKLPVDESFQPSLFNAMQRLSQIQTNYYVGFFGTLHWKDIVVQLYRYNNINMDDLNYRNQHSLIGREDSNWILVDEAKGIAKAISTEYDAVQANGNTSEWAMIPQKAAQRSQEESFQFDLSRALNGSGCVSLRPNREKLHEFNQQWDELLQNETLQALFRSQQQEDMLLETFLFQDDVDADADVTTSYNSELDDLTITEGASCSNGKNDFARVWGGRSPPKANIHSLLAYDAVIAIGMAACHTTSDSFFTTKDLVEAIRQLRFDGASMGVGFDKRTGSRNIMEYQILNVLSTMSNVEMGISKKRDGETRASVEDRIEVEKVAVRMLVVESNHIIVSPDSSLPVVNEIQSFQYPVTWTTIPPPSRSTFNENKNLVGFGIRTFSLILSVVSMGLALLAGCWTVWNRNVMVVKESQPSFLALLSIGTFLMGASMIFLTFQEPTPKHVLDNTCMAFPWLFCCGFTLAHSALFSKIYRINTVYQKSRTFQRVKLRAVDVLLPLLLLMACNITILSVWTVLSPMIWNRAPLVIDSEYGWILESYGSCSYSDDTFGPYFLAAIVLVNLAAVVVANYQSFLARHLPAKYSESQYIALTNFFLLEAAIISIRKLRSMIS